MHAATSLAFSLDGASIFAGFDKKLAVFDLSRPGHSCCELVTKQKRQDGLPGQLPYPTQYPKPCSLRLQLRVSTLLSGSPTLPPKWPMLAGLQPCMR